MSDVVDRRVGMFYFGRYSNHSYAFMEHEKKARLGYTRKIMMRTYMPYGMYICDDGREVLFNRNYAPIWSRYPEQHPVQALPNEIVKNIKKQIWFWPESPNPWSDASIKKHCEEVLSDFFDGKDVTHLGFEP